MVKPSDFHEVNLDFGKLPPQWQQRADGAWEPIAEADRGTFEMACPACGNAFIRNADESVAAHAVLRCTTCEKQQTADRAAIARSRKS